MSEVAIGVIVLLVVIFGFSAFKTVNQGMEYTVQRFGRYTKTLKPGFHIIIPFIDVIGYKMNMRERVIDVPNQEVITKDNAMVSVDAVVFVQTMDAARAAYEVDSLDFAVVNLCLTNIRTVVGSMDLDEVLSRRDEINGLLLSVIDRATNPWGLKVTRIEIRDLTPPADITAAMTKQMKAEREKRAEILIAQGEKQSAILRSEGEKRAAILDAEGRKEAAHRDAEARERLAQAEATATAMVSEAIAKGDVQAINYFVAQKYVEAFGKLAESDQQKTVIIPAELSTLASTVGGIGAIIDAAGLSKKEGG